MVVLARGPGCPSRHEPARSQGFGIPADNFPNELARVCDSVGKSPAWRGLDMAFPSHFVMHGLDKVAHVSHVAGPASVRGSGQPAFPAVDGSLAPGPPP